MSGFTFYENAAVLCAVVFVVVVVVVVAPSSSTSRLGTRRSASIASSRV